MELFATFFLSLITTLLKQQRRMSSFLKDACILVSFTVFNIQINPTNTGVNIFNKNSEPDSLLKNILTFTAMVIKYREK